MKSPKTVILALGSNLGDRLGYMQIALEKIHQNIGWVLEVSKIYETPAWGFDGNAFYNACVSVSTRLEAEEVLMEIQKIETGLGRERSNSENYKDRTIDLDILLVEDEVIETSNLKVPHPGIPDRSFVLKPLNDIAGAEKHPILKKKISQLLQETIDTSEISISEDTLKKPEMDFNFPACNYIAVEGNIGAGKTSFSTMVSEDFNAKLILERFKDNPFLPKFYEDKDRYAFSLEMSFLADRYQQLSDDLAQYDLFKDFVISDYDVFKSLIFAKITLHEDEYSLYHKLFHLMYK
ncbi:MAG: 2-amino-4-hydroxy-6-hydroxymethyldihydropteridine diphosphokinase, partial [Gramella sp.]|nr:2-amino-4-hydroxy-6-hydroxymethyldihydropteridine diphosphokinase [Christiangramia sp.]